MIRRRRSGRGLPLALLAAAGCLAACVATVAVVAAVLHALGQLAHLDGTAILAGAATAATVSVAFGYAASRIARGLRELRDDAVHRLRDPHSPVRTPSGGIASELAELAATLEALHLRVRVADEVADRHRRTAEMASAGMFELLSGLVAAEEGARGQLAAELHDTVAQTLMLARSLLSAGEPQSPEALRRVADLVADAEEQVRAVMARTRPPALRDGDLARAVAGLRDDLTLRYGLDVDIRWPDAPHPLPLVTAITVYRFFQEGLLNVVKHCDLDRAAISLEISGDAVVATVRDEGPGFAPEQVAAEQGRHVGLDLLRERARLAGGCIEVLSWPQPGVTLTLRLPRAAAAPVTASVYRPAPPLPATPGLLPSQSVRSA